MSQKLYKEVLNSQFYDKNSIYYETTAEKLSFQSNSLFTEKFIDELRFILVNSTTCGDTFKRLPKHIKEQKVAELNDLLQTETMWKDLVKSSKYNSLKILEIFPEESEQFKKAFNRGFLTQSTDSSLVQRNRKGISKMKKYYAGLFEFIRSKLHILNDRGDTFQFCDKELTTLSSGICPNFLFQDLVKISMKKAYDTNINIEKSNPKHYYQKRLDTNFLKVRKHDLFYSSTKYINMYFTSHLLNYLNEKGLLKNSDVADIIDVLKYFEEIYKDKVHLNLPHENKWYLLSTDLIQIFLSFLELTTLIKYKETEKKKSSNKTVTVYTFNHKLDNSIAFSKNLPRIIPPVKAETSKCVYEWISPVKRGTYNVQASKEALSSLNIAQRKEFVINSKFIKLLQNVDDTQKSTLEFPTKNEYYKTREFFEEWSDSAWSNLIDSTFYRTSKTLFRIKKKTKKDSNSKILKLCNIVFLESFANAAYNEVRADLIKKRSMRQLLLTSIQIGKLYEKYPLYYGTLLDFRLRMYPLQYLMSRTSGYLKNTLEESVPRKLNKEGWVNMLEAYYSPEPDLLNKFKLLDSNEMSSLFKFFQTNKRNLIKQPLYFKMLESELNDLRISKKKGVYTSIQLEIDQVGSGPTLVALLVKNETLARKCNLLGGAFNCIYTFLLEETIKYFKSENNFELKIDVINSKAYKLLTSNRQSQKYALMCFFYNEQHKSRTERWVIQYEAEYGLDITQEEFELISAFSVKYADFMSSCFPGLNKQLRILNDAMLILVKQGLPVKLGTLDECILSWDFSNSIELKRNYYNPASGSHEQYKYYVNSNDPQKKSSTRVNKHRLSFRPNFVHSIDSAIMRIFIQKFYKKTKKRLNHLHDCVMLHPNDVEHFYDIVSEVYCDEKMMTLAENLFFRKIKEDLTGEPLAKVEKLEKEFLENSDDFKITKNVFDPRKCYRYEGSK